MTQKTISLNDKAYKNLRKLKKKGESFSELILRLCSSQGQSNEGDLLLKLIGTFKENADYWEKIENQILKSREKHLTTEEEE